MYRILILAMVLLLAGVGRAQERRFEAGLVAGVNLSQIDGDKLAGFNKLGINVGGKVAAVLSERWLLSLELLFSQQGASRTRVDDPSSIYEKIKLNFVEVPVMINFKEWKFHVSAGASYGRLIDYTVIDFTGEDISEIEQYNPDLFSLILGITYYFRDNAGVDFRWQRALSDLQGIDGGSQLTGRTLSCRFVYLF